MKRILLLLAFFSVFLILSISFIPSAQVNIIEDEIENKLSNILIEPLFIILLIILMVVDIPIVIFSLLVSIILYLIYIPTQLIAYIYQNYFWEDKPLIPDASPIIIVYVFFAILLIFVGLPIIFMLGAGLYFVNLGYEEFSDYFISAMRVYGNFISSLLRLGFE